MRSPRRLVSLLARLDRVRPPYGPCGHCGGPDARHRIWDSVYDRVRTSDGIAGTARDLGVTVAEVRLVRQAYDEARRRHARLPGGYPLAGGPTSSSGAAGKAFLSAGEAGRALPRTA
jgi:hypothetical protein